MNKPHQDREVTLNIYLTKILSPLLIAALVMPVPSVLSQETSPLHELTVSAAARGIRDGEFTAVELLDSLLARIEQHEHLNAFISIDREGAFTRARLIDEARERGERLGPLAGVPLVIKDNINTVNLPTTGGTPALAAFQPEANAPVIERLLAADAIILGKTNMHEMAFGITSDNAHFGPVGNAYDATRFAGGSSGGTGAAVGARLAPGGLGTDTGGSVRIPAALNGIAGLRPTVGRYPRDGIIPISSTRDTAGPMARSVADLILLDNVITGYDQPIGPADLSTLRLGLPEQRFWGDLESETRTIAERFVSQLRAAGATVVWVDVQELVALVAGSDRTSAMYEARRELVRFLDEFNTGVTLAELVEAIASPDVKGPFETSVLDATAVTPEAYRTWMETQRPAIQAAYRAVFAGNNLDALLFPTTPMPAVSFEEAIEVSLNGRLRPTFPTFARNTSPSTVAGLPGLTIPIGLTTDGMPVGIELDGPPLTDRRILSIGLALETLAGSVPGPE